MNHQDWGGQVDSALDCARRGVLERFGDKITVKDVGSFNPASVTKFQGTKRPFRVAMNGVEVAVDVFDWSGSLMTGFRTQFEIRRNDQKVETIPLEHRENFTDQAGKQLTEAIARAFA